ncbi:MAG: terpene cyclase/mutase family protein [bacterium]|nr:terpene cyclase/mutase family protein [bacterium]
MDRLLPTAVSLRNMISEMNRKNLDLKRITKTASLLVLSGLSENSIPRPIIERCLDEQQSDGGWVAVVDTMWNTFFLKRLDPVLYKKAIDKALDFLLSQVNADGLWGRSQRDISRIPVTGALFYLLPELADPERLSLLEELWQSEKNSLTYKAAYTLMAFRAAHYSPRRKESIIGTLDWLVENQGVDGGFAPWKSHPAPPDVFCTSVAVSGLLQYKETVPPRVFQKAFHWLLETRLPDGIWPYHEIEDGASWGLYALTQLKKAGIDGHG